MPTETLINLERGRKVKPFEGKKEFLPVDFEELLNVLHSMPQEVPVLTTDLEFEGVKGSLSAVASSRVGTEKAQTPLGPVKTEIEHNNKLVTVKQVPLYLRLVFEIESFQDWQKLLNNSAMLELGDKQYLVSYHIQDLGITVAEFEKSLHTFKKIPAIGRFLIDLETYRPERPILPYDLDRLSQVGLTLNHPVPLLDRSTN